MIQLPTAYCTFCLHPAHLTWACDVVKTSARLRWSSRCECSNYNAADLNSSDQSPHKCSFCSDSFVTREGLDIHDNLEHEPRYENPDSAK